MRAGRVPALWLALLLAAAPARGRGADSTYEIVSHRYRLEILPGERGVRCTDTLGIRLAPDAEDDISLRLFPLYRVSSVAVRGRPVEFSVSNDRLLVQDIGRDTIVDVEVQYAGRLPVITEFAQVSEERAVFHEEGILPHGPEALRFVRGAITVPFGWSAIAVGALVAEVRSNDSATFVWEFEGPIPTVGWLCAGPFAREEIRDGPLTISTFLAREDSASAPSVLARAKEVLRFYSGWFTPYRFSKLAIVEVDNAVAGRNILAVAAPSFILVKKLAFETKDVYNQVLSILPHEIAHQWWPSTVFIGDEDAAFLSEGLCEYSALMFAESAGTGTARDSLGRHPLLRSLLSRVAKGEDRPLRQRADLRALPTHYLKASYVHNMLRTIMGESLFRRLYAQYAVRFHLAKAELSDFQSVAESLYGRTLGWFFAQWVTGRGIPRLKIYNVKSALGARGWTTKGRVRIVGYEKYTALVSVGVETDSAGTAGTEVWIGTDSSGVYRNDVAFEISSGGREPLRAILDPDGGLLKAQRIAVKFGELRDPDAGVMIIGGGPHRERLWQLARRDSAAMDASGWSLQLKSDSASTLADLQRDRVFLYGTEAENSVVREIAGKFPMRSGGDSVEVEGEMVRDSTLALLQAIENPFRASGMLCWIAPLSPAANPELLPHDYSWVLVRGNEPIAHGNWEVTDEDLVVELSGGADRKPR